MEKYLDLCAHVLSHGKKREDRTGTGTLGVFGYQARYSLEDGFPLLTTKTVNFKAIVYELLWFLKGSTNVKWLQEQGVHIWDAWADAQGELGPVYGRQWRSWAAPDGGRIDQIARLIEGIQKDPHSRRHLVSAWNPAEVDSMALPPCHTLFQFYVEEGRLSCQLYQRSADLFLGVPFNIASYSLLTLMIARVCGLKADTFIHTIGDAHIYLNHLEAVKIQLSRAPRPLPRLLINPAVSSIDGFSFEDFTLIGYDPHPPIKAEISV